MKNLPWKGRGQDQVTRFRILHTMWYISGTADARDFRFCIGVGRVNISLVVTGCPLSGRGQGHMSNFYILDLENFATASRRCTGVINVDGQLVDYTYDGRARRGWMHKFIIGPYVGLL